MAIIGDGDEIISYNLEYRSTKDDAWYTSGVLLEDGKQLRVSFQEFAETYNDEVFSVADFTNDGEIEEFLRRFRTVSAPMEDNECSRVIEGVLVCATYTRDGSVRFFDAIVEAVHYKEHTPEKCLCTYLLFWQHGPDEGNVTAANVDDICFLMPGTVDPRVADFAKLVKEKLRGASSQPSSIFGRSTWDSRSPRKIKSNQTLNKRSDSAGHNSYVRFSGVTGRGNFYPQISDEDGDLGGVKERGLHHYIVLENLEKDLSPSLIMEFIHEQTSISAEAYVFPSLSVESYTRGAIVSESRTKLKRIYEFIRNPNHFIVSLTARPWVMVEDMIWTATFETNFPSLERDPEDYETKSKLMVVRSGTEEYLRAKRLKGLYMEFRNHLNGLLWRLDLEEKKISHPN